MPGKTPGRRRAGLVSGLKIFLAKYFPSVDQFRHLPKVLSKKERYIVLFLALASFGALLAAPISAYVHLTVAKPDYGGSFTEGMVGTPKYINPLLAQTSDVDRDLSSLIYAGLMKYDDSGNIAGDLAESYEVSGDGLTYTVKLKDNLKWQDGQSLTADDVVFTVLTAQNADYGSFQRINWLGVDVSKADDKTVVFRLKVKYAQFMTGLTLGILPKHLWENVKPASFGLSELNLKPVGAGPFKFSRIKKDSSGNVTSYEVAAFDQYHSGRPYISKIIFNFYASEDKMIAAFNSNQIDGLSFVSAEKLSTIKFSGKLQIESLKLPRYFAVFFNQNQSTQLSDKNIRQALNYATDKKAIIDAVLAGKGEPVDSPMLPDIIGISGAYQKYDFNIEKAKKLLDDAGWKLADGKTVREKAPPAVAASKTKKTASATPAPVIEPAKLEVRLTTSNWPELVAVANELKIQWEKAGAQLNVEVLPLPELQQVIKERTYEALLFGEVLGLDPEPFSFWHSSQKKDPGLNLALYDNKESDTILESARQILDRGARFQKYAEFQKLVIDAASVVFLFSPDYLYALPAKITAVFPKVISVPSDRFNYINKWFIDTQRNFKK